MVFYLFKKGSSFTIFSVKLIIEIKNSAVLKLKCLNSFHQEAVLKLLKLCSNYCLILLGLVDIFKQLIRNEDNRWLTAFICSVNLVQQPKKKKAELGIVMVLFQFSWFHYWECMTFVAFIFLNILCFKIGVRLSILVANLACSSFKGTRFITKSGWLNLTWTISLKFLGLH